MNLSDMCAALDILEYFICISQVFLEPLKKLVGSMEAPSLLLSSCLTQFQRSRLHQLGFALGISQWIEDFRSRVSYGKGEDFELNLAALEDEERKRPIAVVRPVPSSNEQINQLSEVSTDQHLWHNTL